MKKNIKDLIHFFLRMYQGKSSKTALTFHHIPESYFAWFEELILSLKETHRFLTAEEALRKDTESGILLTFDDGFYSSRVIAEKILKKYNIPSIFFVSSGFINSNENKYESFVNNQFYPRRLEAIECDKLMKPMSWDDVNWLQDNGFEIGGHTVNHYSLSDLKRIDLKNEILNDREELKGRTGKRPTLFAYPFGGRDNISKECINIVRSYYDVAFTNVRGSLNNSKFQHLLFRQNVCLGEPPSHVQNIVQGKLDFLYKGQRIFLDNLVRKNNE